MGQQAHAGSTARDFDFWMGSWQASGVAAARVILVSDSHYPPQSGGRPSQNRSVVQGGSQPLSKMPGLSVYVAVSVTV
jgi:hypothetical protein